MTKLLSGNKRKQGSVEKSNKTKTEGLQNKKEAKSVMVHYKVLC